MCVRERERECVCVCLCVAGSVCACAYLRVFLRDTSAFSVARVSEVHSLIQARAPQIPLARVPQIPPQ